MAMAMARVMLITEPAYTYAANVVAVRDGDSVLVDLDKGLNDWAHDLEIRLYGVNAQEITKSKKHKRGAKEVSQGYDHRDGLLFALGADVGKYPRKARYHRLIEPVPVIVETILDKSGKYGRLLGVLHSQEGNFANINEIVRDMIGGVEFYDNKTYPADYPIRPPQLRSV